MRSFFLILLLYPSEIFCQNQSHTGSGDNVITKIVNNNSYYSLSKEANEYFKTKKKTDALELNYALTSIFYWIANMNDFPMDSLLKENLDLSDTSMVEKLDDYGKKIQREMEKINLNPIITNSNKNRKIWDHYRTVLSSYNQNYFKLSRGHEIYPFLEKKLDQRIKFFNRYNVENLKFFDQFKIHATEFPLKSYLHDKLKKPFDNTIRIDTATECRIAAFVASPASVNLGDSTTLNWSTSGCKSLSITGGRISGNYPKNGSVQINSIYSQTTFVITASNGKEFPSSTVRVRLNSCEIEEFRGIKTTILYGETTKLYYSTRNCKSATLTYENHSIDVKPVDTFVTPPLYKTSTFVIGISSNGVNYSASAIVNVRKPKYGYLTPEQATRLLEFELNETEPNDDSISRYVLAGADVNTTSSSKKFITALHVAAKKNNIYLANLLIHEGADINLRDAYEPTPLWNAVLNSSFEVIKILVDQKSIDINAVVSYTDSTNSKRQKRYTVLDLAKSREIKHFLILNGAKKNNEL